MCCSFPDFQQKDVIVTLAGQPGTEPMTLRLLIKRTNHNTAAIPPPSLFLFPSVSLYLINYLQKFSFQLVLETKNLRPSLLPW